MLTFEIESETDLHIKVISFLKKKYPHSLFTVMSGKNQNTSIKRIESQHNLLILENVPRIHPSEVNNILKE